MEDRRSLNRLQVDTRFDDLQAEMESAWRILSKIEVGTSTLDTHGRVHLQQSTMTSALRRQFADLRRSLSTQRSTLRQLRAEMRRLRAHFRDRAPR